MMVIAKKPKICFTEEQWDFVEKKIEEYRSADDKPSLKEVCECVVEDLKTHQMFKIDMPGTKLLANYYNRRLAKKKSYSEQKDLTDLKEIKQKLSTENSLEELRDALYPKFHAIDGHGTWEKNKSISNLIDEIENKFTALFRNAHKKKHGKSLVVADPNDIRYILLIYGPSGAYKPTFHCDKLHLQRRVEDETTANGGIPPKMKIFTPVTFRVNIEEVHGDV